MKLLADVISSKLQIYHLFYLFFSLFFPLPPVSVCVKSAEYCLHLIYGPLLTNSYQVPTSPFLMQLMSE